MSSIQFGGTSTFLPSVFFWLGVISTTLLKNKTRKIVKIYKEFEL